MEDKSLDAIFPFKLEELSTMPLFNGAVLKEKPITIMYTDTTNTMALLIDFEKEKPKPTWEAYQVLWADEEHNELLPILSWDDNRKGKQTNKLT
ncbi:hypothetical protein G9A89_013158 [Geosiphon pyriformis]|nr:hypothetical protein G9A89_013158 [Geosiphon pyriformis]